MTVCCVQDLLNENDKATTQLRKLKQQTLQQQQEIHSLKLQLGQAKQQQQKLQAQNEQLLQQLSTAPKPSFSVVDSLHQAVQSTAREETGNKAAGRKLSTTQVAAKKIFKSPVQAALAMPASSRPRWNSTLSTTIKSNAHTATNVTALPVVPTSSSSGSTLSRNPSLTNATSSATTSAPATMYPRPPGGVLGAANVPPVPAVPAVAPYNMYAAHTGFPPFPMVPSPGVGQPPMLPPHMMMYYGQHQSSGPGFSVPPGNVSAGGANINGSNAGKAGQTPPQHPNSVPPFYPPSPMPQMALPPHILQQQQQHFFMMMQQQQQQQQQQHPESMTRQPSQHQKRSQQAVPAQPQPPRAPILEGKSSFGETIKAAAAAAAASEKSATGSSEHQRQVLSSVIDGSAVRSMPNRPALLDTASANSIRASSPHRLSSLSVDSVDHNSSNGSLIQRESNMPALSSADLNPPVQPPPRALLAHRRTSRSNSNSGSPHHATDAARNFPAPATNAQQQQALMQYRMQQVITYDV